MNLQTSYWMIQQTGGGTTVNMAKEMGLTNTDDFASHCSALYNKDKLVTRKLAPPGSPTSVKFEYYPTKKGDKHFAKPLQKSKLQTVKWLNENVRGPVVPRNTPKSSQAQLFEQAGMNEDDILLMRAAQRSINQRKDRKKFLTMLLEPIIRELLSNGDVVTLTYNPHKVVYFNYSDYDSLANDSTLESEYLDDNQQLIEG